MRRKKEAPVERSYYTAADLRQELEDFERRYGMSSADFYDAYARRSVPASVVSFDRVVWADTYREACRMSIRPVPAGAC